MYCVKSERKCITSLDPTVFHPVTPLLFYSVTTQSQKLRGKITCNTRALAENLTKQNNGFQRIQKGAHSSRNFNNGLY